MFASWPKHQYYSVSYSTIINVNTVFSLNESNIIDHLEIFEQAMWCKDRLSSCLILFVNLGTPDEGHCL